MLPPPYTMTVCLYQTTRHHMLYHCEYLKSRNDNIIILSVLIFELLGTRWEKHKLLN